MKRLLNSISYYLSSVPEYVQKRKFLVLMIFTILTLIFIHGITKLKFDFTLEKWFEQDDAAFIAYNEFHYQFGSEDGVVIVYEAKDGDIFSNQSLLAVKGILDDLLYYQAELKEGEESALDHIVDVDCLINAPVFIVEDDFLMSTDLVGEIVPSSQGALDKIRKTAQSEKDFPLTYFSEDMKYGAIYIKTDFGAIPIDADDEQAVTDIAIDMISEVNNSELIDNSSTPRFKPTDTADYLALNSALNDILSKSVYTNHLEFYKVGSTIESENQLKMGKEVAILYIAALTIMLIMLMMIFRSLSAAVWSFLIVILSTVWTLGFAGLFGLPATPFVVLTILLILTLGMADAIHIISGYLFFRNTDLDFKSSLCAAYKKSGLACLLTTITTMVGVLSLLFTDLVPIRNFSIMSAIGVAIALLLTIYLLPVLLDLWAPVPKHKKDRKNILTKLNKMVLPDFVPALQKALDKVIPIVEKRPHFYIIIFSVIFLVCIYGAFQVNVNYSSYDQYSKDSNFYKSIKLMDEKMAGSSRMSLYVDLGKDNAFQDPAVLQVIEDMQNKLENSYKKYVVTTHSIVNIVKDAYQKLNEGRNEMYTIPKTEKDLSQTLFMFNTADPEEREKVVSENYRKANIDVTLRSYGSNEYTKVFSKMKKDINDSLLIIKKNYPDATVSITGLFVMGLTAADYIMFTELQSFGITLLVISIILLIIFSSLKAGLISILPNLIPSFLVLGTMGLLNIHLDFYTMMLAPIVVGIAVDDTIHFVTLYRSEVLKYGNINMALRNTVKECGQAIVFTSLVLGLGFGIMSIASSPGYANLGKFGLLSIFSALICELLLTPALILVFKLKFVSNQEIEPIPQSAQA